MCYVYVYGTSRGSLAIDRIWQGFCPTAHYSTPNVVGALKAYRPRQFHAMKDFLHFNQAAQVLAHSPTIRKTASYKPCGWTAQEYGRRSQAHSSGGR